MTVEAAGRTPRAEVTRAAVGTIRAAPHTASAIDPPVDAPG
ncbi:hypothetical protein QNO09_12320 [Streptomyces sp. 378]|nr:hypothetical protein [Streptomyces sp. 378]MDK1344076.1 hypothetical protein [Streptomyces sp. 378]